MIRLLSMLLLISALGAKGLAQAPSQQDKSVSPSPVRTNALALIDELETPGICPPDDTTCFSEITLRKLTAAIAGLKSIVRLDEQREGIIVDMQTRIDIRGDVIADLRQVDKNSQRIDTLGQDSKAIYEKQHQDDKDTIVDITNKLESCQSSQKWIAGISAIGGGLLGYKLRGSGVVQSPFAFITSSGSQVKTTGLSFLSFESESEQRLRQALKNLQK